jgi:hypothetical protein
MLSIYTVINLLFVHWVGDFILQSDAMAKGKSSENKWLFLHCLVYSSLFALVYIDLWFGLLLFITHFVTDYFTSRINKKLWEEQKVHDFFVMVGFDQLIHFVTILILFYYFRF